MARKTLLAVAGLVSVHDGSWTTDRYLAARRWAEIRPPQAAALERLAAWSEATRAASRRELQLVLDAGGVVGQVVQDFGELIGLWS